MASRGTSWRVAPELVANTTYIPAPPSPMTGNGHIELFKVTSWHSVGDSTSWVWPTVPYVHISCNAIGILPTYVTTPNVITYIKCKSNRKCNKKNYTKWNTNHICNKRFTPNVISTVNVIENYTKCNINRKCNKKITPNVITDRTNSQPQM